MDVTASDSKRHPPTDSIHNRNSRWQNSGHRERRLSGSLPLRCAAVRRFFLSKMRKHLLFVWGIFASAERSYLRSLVHFRVRWIWCLCEQRMVIPTLPRSFKKFCLVPSWDPEPRLASFHVGNRMEQRKNRIGIAWFPLIRRRCVCRADGTTETFSPSGHITTSCRRYWIGLSSALHRYLRWDWYLYPAWFFQCLDATSSQKQRCNSRLSDSHLPWSSQWLG